MKSNTHLKFRIFLFLLIFSTAYCLLPTAYFSSAHAQSLSLSISPPLLEVFIKPGKSITQKYKLTNNAERVTISIKLGQLNEYGIKQSITSEPDRWISIIQSDIDFSKPFALESRQSKEFVLAIQPSSQLQEQDYYRALVFSTESSISAQSSASTISQDLVSPLLITLTSTGQVNKAAKISRFDMPQFLDSFGPLKVDIVVENTGNTYFRPNGLISLAGPLAKGTFKIEPNVVFPGTKKVLKTTSSTDKVSSLNLPGFYLGKYEVRVDFTLDESTIKLDQTRTFYALPWKAGLIFVSISIIILIVKRRKSRSKKT